MRNEPKKDSNGLDHNGKEAPAVYEIGQVGGQTALTRRTFLEMAAAAAAAAGVASLTGGCAATGAASGATGGDGPLPESPPTALAHKEPVTALAVNAPGKLLASGDKGGTVKLWQLPEGLLLHTWSGGDSAIVDVAFPEAPDALWTLSASGSFKRWSLPEAHDLPANGKQHPSQIAHPLAVASSGDWYAISGARRGEIEVRSQATGQITRALKAPDDAPDVLVASADGRLLMVGDNAGNLGWATLDGASTKIVDSGDAVSALAVSPKAELAVSAHPNASVQLWNVPAMSLVSTYWSLKAYAVAVRSQLDLYVAGSDADIAMWRIGGAEARPALLKGHTGPVRATVITPDGGLLISGGDDKTIRLWSLPDGKTVGNCVDLDANYDSVKGTRFEGRDAYGRTIAFTLPCGSPIPAGAVCTCNCVPGTLTIPTNHTQQFSGGVCSCDLVCTCNSVCTCQSVGGGYYVSYWYPN